MCVWIKRLHACVSHVRTCVRVLGRPDVECVGLVFFYYLFAAQICLDCLPSFSSPRVLYCGLRRLASEELAAPEYKVLKATGRASETPIVVVGVFAGDNKLGEGAGFSDESAEMAAAKTALMTYCVLLACVWACVVAYICVTTT